MKAVAHRKGPDRLLDLGLRAGPYGDNFGSEIRRTESEQSDGGAKMALILDL